MDHSNHAEKQFDSLDIDFGLNNFIAREISPHSPKVPAEKTARKEIAILGLNTELPSGRQTPLSGRSTPQSGRETPTDKPKYQLWPSMKKAVNGRQSPDSVMSLSMNHSVPMLRREASSESVTTRTRGGSLPRRRNISIPELGIAPMTTVQERPNDSPTIPGHFPVHVHERSNSAPANNVRRILHEESKLSPVIDLTPLATGWKPSNADLSPLRYHEVPSSPRSVKRASSVLLPDDDDIIALPILLPTTFNPLEKVESAKGRLETRRSDTPPAVPPKSPRLRLRIAPVNAPMPTQPAEAIAAKLPASLQAPAPLTSPDAISPNPFTMGWPSPDSQVKPWNNTERGSPVASSVTSNYGHRHNGSNATATTAQTTPSSTTSMKMSRSNSVSNLQRTRSNSNNDNGTLYNFSHRHRREESEGSVPSSVLDRGRPTKRIEGQIKRKLTSRFAAPDQSFGKLPSGYVAPVAPLQMSAQDMEAVHRQALEQAEKFEVLSYKEVKQLSRELRSLDERCEYLRKTHNSLRDGRRELHDRMIAYLKSPRLAKFSRESILRQEVALAELDRSIDEWITKLDYAENRRARVRQKVLEHVAAALTLPKSSSKSSSPQPLFSEEQTPPRSPEKVESPQTLDRSDVESIKIYASSGVYNLLADIEQEIENMVSPGIVQ